MAAKKRTRANADAGVMHCMKLMADGLWVSGTSHDAVARRFGVAPATVKDWATCASRMLRLATEGDREEMRARLYTTLERVISTAMLTVKPVTVHTAKGKKGVTKFVAAPSLNAAVQAIETQAKLLGLITQHVDITTQKSVAHLSRDEHLAELERLKADIAAEEKRIREEAVH